MFLFCLVLLINHPQVSDFGLSREVEMAGGDYVATGNGIVPLRWTAPEALVLHQFSTASDVWAFAVLAGEVFDNGAMVRCVLV